MISWERSQKKGEKKLSSLVLSWHFPPTYWTRGSAFSFCPGLISYEACPPSHGIPHFLSQLTGEEPCFDLIHLPLPSLWSAPTARWLVPLTMRAIDSFQTIPVCLSPSQPSYFSFGGCSVLVSFPYRQRVCWAPSSWPLSSSAHNYVGFNV